MEKHLVTDDYVINTASKRWGIAPKRTGQEWHSPCYVCGGRDRFIVFANGGYYCRQCETHGWLDEDRRDWKPDPILAQKWVEEQATRKAQQYARDAEWRAGFKVGYVRGWCDAMGVREHGWWNAQGISNYQIGHYALGYNPSKKIRVDGEIVSAPAFTIPIRDPDDWETIVNVQYRIADPPDGAGKYRQEEGISAAAFYAEPSGINERAIIVEGAKKAMVVYDRLDGAVQIIGVPGCTPSAQIIERIAKKKYERVYIALDPGCTAQAERIAAGLGGARIMNLPEKPDDAFLSGAMTADKFRAFAAQAREAGTR